MKRIEDKIYIRNLDVDGLIRSIGDTMPFIDSEILYLSELEFQKRIFFAFFVFGFLLFLFAVML